MKSKKLNIFVNEDGIKRNDIVGDFWKKILLGTRYFVVLVCNKNLSNTHTILFTSIFNFFCLSHQNFKNVLGKSCSDTFIDHPSPKKNKTKLELESVTSPDYKHHNTV